MAEPPQSSERIPRNEEPEVSSIRDASDRLGDEKDIETEIPTKLSSNGGGKSEKVDSGEAAETEKKPGLAKRAWDALGLNPGILLMMFKGSVAPTIGVAFYQAHSVASIYSTLGYLVPIITVISVPIMPRAKFFQTLILNIIGICIGSAIAMLGIWSSIKAQEHTTPAGSRQQYNSSQSAVCAIWLFANIYFVNCMRAKVPALQFPVIMYSIFTNVAFTFAPLFQTVVEGEALIKRLLEGFLTAFAIASAVNLFIVPMTSRNVLFKELEGYIGAVRGTLKAQTAYLQSLETSDMFTETTTGDDKHSKDDKNRKKAGKKDNPISTQTPQAKALKGAIGGLKALHGKVYGDLPFAKREIAWGKLEAKDLDEIFVLLRAILIPLVGLSTITDIFERIAERRGWTHAARTQHDEAEAWEHAEEEAKNEEKRVWNEIMKTLHEPFVVLVTALDEGLEHAGLTLELITPPKKKKGEDEESKSADPKPGQPEFTKFLNTRTKDFYGGRGHTLKAWAKEKGLSAEQFDSFHGSTSGENQLNPNEIQHGRDQQQLYLILYMEFLLYSVGLAVANLVKFADKKVEDGVMKKNRLILPGLRRLKKWITSIGNEDSTIDTESPDNLEAGSRNIYMGSGFNPKKDPEHLPPATVWQHFGNGLRVIPRFLGSTESAFGFRVACATLTIGIVAFLKETQVFFIEQRLVWAMIIIAIGMTMTSGQSIFGFFTRIGGTALSMVFSFVIWYIVDQKTPGVIVFLWFFIFLEMYFFLKFPRFIAVWLICIVTQVLIIGYELQVRKIGIVAASASGQPYYPIYELAPYRLACVAGGSFVAFIWTIFPYPISDRSWLRRDLGSTLYLLANYHAVIHSTIGARMHNTEGDMDLKTSPGRRLKKVRHKIFGKLLMILPSLQQHADWEKWELTIGGKFPRDTYEDITIRATNIMNYMSLISYAAQSWSQDGGSAYPNTIPAARRAWIDDLALLVDKIGPTSHSVTSILSLLSASVKTGTALPPYMQLPEPYNLTKRLQALDKGILDARHVEEPGYSAYAVMQVASAMMMDDLKRLVDSVKDLVGETDFSFRVDVSDSSVDSTGSETSEGRKGKRD
ncbi:hypothetical protein G7Y89_g102 [Cudoniella acicularis]|uniref:ER transporter 6TM N-terminal domain-containing protein n=1 Tax=Cudoniella acicularis TaxID=354080 RepID=A0A8H4RYN4_9HELO|nr:hypothetical protein G7Y89_g102 [Cudoniella acicularis]